MSKVVVVLGMHRSGTSLVALILKELGVNMGDETLHAGSSNPFGHEEDVAFLDLNERFLRKAKGAWDFPPSKSSLDRVAHQFEAEISQLIADRDSQNEWWGWKEPRTALLFKYYREHLCDYKVVHVTRSIGSIAASLSKRDRMPLRKGQRLCACYNDRLNESLSDIGDKVFRINYEDLIEDGDVIVKRLINFLGIEADEYQYANAVKMIKSKSDIQKYSRVSARDEFRANVFRAMAHPVMGCRYCFRKCYRFFRYRFER